MILSAGLTGLCCINCNYVCVIVGNSLPRNRSQSKFLSGDEHDDDDDIASSMMPPHSQFNHLIFSPLHSAVFCQLLCYVCNDMFNYMFMGCVLYSLVNNLSFLTQKLNSLCRFG